MSCLVFLRTSTVCSNDCGDGHHQSLGCWLDFVASCNAGTVINRYGGGLISWHPCTPRTDHRFLIDDLDLSRRIDSRSVPGMICQVAHAAEWETYSLHDLGYVSWVRFVLNRSCTTSHNGRLGSRLSRSWSVGHGNCFCWNDGSSDRHLSWGWWPDFVTSGSVETGVNRWGGGPISWPLSCFVSSFTIVLPRYFFYSCLFGPTEEQARRAMKTTSFILCAGDIFALGAMVVDKTLK